MEAAQDQSAEARLAHLASAAGTLRHAMAAIAARLLERRAYEPLCYARVGDCARERAGLSARQLHDLAHTHRALAALLRLERALLANELSWSKVRLVARVAAPDDEQAWIDRARDVPVRRLEREVRASAPHVARDETNEGEPGLALTRVTVYCTPAVREKWAQTREMAERVAGQRLRANEVLEWVTAEACSALSIDRFLTDALEAPAGRARGESADAAGDEALDRGGLARALPRHPSSALEPLLASLEHADGFELDRRLRLAVRLEQTLDAVAACPRSHEPTRS